MAGPVKYRKKPVVVEAMRLAEPYSQVQTFCPGLVLVKNGATVAFAVIPTLEGDMTANLGDYIIRGVKGEFYPCKSEIFEATYEVVR